MGANGVSSRGVSDRPTTRAVSADSSRSILLRFFFFFSHTVYRRLIHPGAFGATARIDRRKILGDSQPRTDLRCIGAYNTLLYIYIYISNTNDRSACSRFCFMYIISSLFTSHKQKYISLKIWCDIKSISRVFKNLFENLYFTNSPLRGLSESFVRVNFTKKFGFEDFIGLLILNSPPSKVWLTLNNEIAVDEIILWKTIVLTCKRQKKNW